MDLYTFNNFYRNPKKAQKMEKSEKRGFLEVLA